MSLRFPYLFKRSIACLLFVSIFLAVACIGCDKVEKTEEKIELNYTVVPKHEQSEKLTRLIEKKKKDPFRLSYIDDDGLYIVEGFGEKNSAGYQVVVEKLYVQASAVYFNAILKGPQSNRQSYEKTYPYIVVKVERREEPVVFL